MAVKVKPAEGYTMDQLRGMTTEQFSALPREEQEKLYNWYGTGDNWFFLNNKSMRPMELRKVMSQPTPTVQLPEVTVTAPRVTPAKPTQLAVETDWTPEELKEAQTPEPKIVHYNSVAAFPYEQAARHAGDIPALMIAPAMAAPGLAVFGGMAAEAGVGEALGAAGRAVIKNAPKMASNKLVADATKTGILTRAAQKFTDWKTNHPTLYKYGKWGAIGGAGYEALNIYGKSGGTGDSGSDGGYDTYNITDGDMTPGE